LDEKENREHSKSMECKADRITRCANSKNELRVTEIKPAEYKLVNIKEAIEKQTHLTPAERNQLRTMLVDFQDLFKGQRGHYNGEPIELELLSGSKPFYDKPFSIPKAYQQVM
jgi:hypothetical protein